MVRRWIFGDQLGSHFTADLGPQDEVVLIVSRGVFARRRYHRAKAHLLLTAMHRRAAELDVRVHVVDRYVDALAQVRPDEVVEPTSKAARAFVRRLGLRVLHSRGFVTDHEEFQTWASGRRRLLLEDWYRYVRTSRDVLMQDGAPAGGRWNFDHDNRLPPPRKATCLGLPEPWQPVEDAFDAQVRVLLDDWQRSGAVQWIGDDGPRTFAAGAAEAGAVLDDFVQHRLASFGPYEDATMAADWVMAHSLLSPAMNLGLIHPMEVVQRCVAAFHAGAAPIASVEAITRQILGWREYVWHLYWWQDPRGADPAPNALQATVPLPEWFADLDVAEVQAACLRGSLQEVRTRGWSHHIVRLMILGNWALQRGYQPQQVADWFTRAFVDGYPWVMTANVIGMSQYADGGRMATKPYVAGGAYIQRMTNYCTGCVYRPQVRVGPQACPFAAGYWAFLHRHRGLLASNHRMSQALRGLDRLADLPTLLTQEEHRGVVAP